MNHYIYAQILNMQAMAKTFGSVSKPPWKRSVRNWIK